MSMEDQHKAGKLARAIGLSKLRLSAGIYQAEAYNGIVYEERLCMNL